MEDKQIYDQYFIELKERVVSSGIKRKTPMYGMIAIIIIIGVFLGGLYSIGKVPIWVSIGLFYILISQLAFVSHDLSHTQYFHNKKFEMFMTYLVGALFFGMGYYWWVDKHNLKHHVFTNSDLHDGDIMEADNAFIKTESKYLFFQKHRAVLYWLLTPMMYMYLLFLSQSFSIKKKKYLDSILSSIPVIALLSVFVYNFGFLYGLGFVLVIYLLAGAHLGLSFMVNHIGMEVIDGKKVKEYSWFDLQTRTSRNISGGYLVHFLFGGLNKQVEHHLFPYISRFQYFKLSQIVRKFCVEKGIIYHEVSFGQALKEIQRALK